METRHAVETSILWYGSLNSVPTSRVQFQPWQLPPPNSLPLMPASSPRPANSPLTSGWGDEASSLKTTGTLGML
jgi:hypothetical protein